MNAALYYKLVILTPAINIFYLLPYRFLPFINTYWNRRLDGLHP